MTLKSNSLDTDFVEPGEHFWAFNWTTWERQRRAVEIRKKKESASSQDGEIDRTIKKWSTNNFETLLTGKYACDGERVRFAQWKYVTSFEHFNGHGAFEPKWFWFTVA